MSDWVQISIVLAGLAVFGRLLYMQRLAIAERLAVELMAYSDGVKARRAARSHWREHLRTQPKILEARARS